MMVFSFTLDLDQCATAKFKWPDGKTANVSRVTRIVCSLLVK